MCRRRVCVQCNDNVLVELPVDIGLLSSLDDLRLDNNRLSQLPVSVAALRRLRRITFANNPLVNIPDDFPQRAADVRQYLGSLHEDPVINCTVKLVVVGQERAGKTSLMNAIKSTGWRLPHRYTANIPFPLLALSCSVLSAVLDPRVGHGRTFSIYLCPLLF